MTVIPRLLMRYALGVLALAAVACPKAPGEAAADFRAQIGTCVESGNTKMLWLFHSIAQRLH